ncbi:MFS transporter [Chitinimonas arctica]|uniref:MFS transporter n=1 Tax=Chitinimonas arctica TaxID=2594795 RepID=A0A516SHE7_9NEIS|nr:MFS transporter [Chitinimonas arctica]QDQ27591.1 MFS transporter [Chitinimonas arctica]
MSPLELRASAGLAGLYALRMLGMFLVLPVFALYARQLPGGDNHTLVGFALGIYGLTQAMLQLPLGMLSDRIGRKPVIYGGLLMLILGSVVAALAHDLVWIAIGRAIAGAGAISAAITALLADLTREENRTKAMAMVGGSIGVTFAVSLVAAPALAGQIGLSGIFWLTAGLALAAIAGVWKIIPDPSQSRFHSDAEANPKRLGDVLRDPQLLRLNYGVFALHAAQMALFVTLPLALVETAGLASSEHWKIYLPVMAVGFVLMVPAVIVAETRNKLKQVFLAAVALMLLAQLGMAGGFDTVPRIVAWLGVYFIAFNILEATQPSLISKIAPADAKGTAMGVYNTTQALGFAVGSAAGGWLYHHGGALPVHVFCAVLIGIWLLVTLGLKPPMPVRTMMYHIADAQLGNAAELARQLARLDGVKEAVVIAEEGVAYLKVLREGWDEAGAKRLLDL